MKLSQFNIVTKLNENEYLLFNTFTTSLVVLESQSYNDIFIDCNMNNEYVGDLMQMGFFVDDDVDEYGEIVKIREQLINEHEGVVGITILLTTACNARCYYCFEKTSKTKK